MIPRLLLAAALVVAGHAAFGQERVLVPRYGIKGLALDPAGRYLAIVASPDPGDVTLGASQIIDLDRNRVVWQRLGEPGRDLSHPFEPASSISFTADGSEALVSEADGSISVVSLSDGVQGPSWGGRAAGALRQVTPVPGGSDVVALQGQNLVIVPRGKPVRVLVAAKGRYVAFAAVSGDGRWAAVGDDVQVIFHDLRSGAQKVVANPSRKPVTSLSLNADGSTAVAVADRQMQVYSRTTGTATQRGGAGVAVASTAAGAFVGLDQFGAFYLDPMSGSRKSIATPRLNGPAYLYLGVSASGRRVVAAAEFGSVAILDPALSISRVLDNPTMRLATAVPGKGAFLVDTARGGVYWNGALLPGIRAAYGVAVDASAAKAVISDYETLHFVTIGSVAAPVVVRGSGWRYAHGVAITADGKRAAVAGDNGGVTIYDTATGAVVGSPKQSRPGYLLSLAFDAGGSRLAQVIPLSTTGSVPQSSIEVYEAPAWKPRTVGRIQGELYAAAAAFTPDGSRLLVGKADGSVEAWDLRTGEPAVTYRPAAGDSPGVVEALAINPGRGLLAVGGRAGTVIYSLADGTQRAATSHGSLRLAFSPGGDVLVMDDPVYSAAFFEIATGRSTFGVAARDAPPSIITPDEEPLIGPLAASARDWTDTVAYGRPQAPVAADPAPAAPEPATPVPAIPVRVVWTIRNGDVAAVPEALQLLPGAGEPVAVSSRPKYVAWYLAVDAEAGMAYWTSVGSVTRARLDGSGAPLTWDAGLAPVGIAWDPRERRVYWADGVAKVIKSSRADGTDVQVILHTATRPGGLALDADARLIFWTEDESGSVYSASIADPQPKRVVNGRTSVGPAIAVDPAAGRAYWGEMEAIASAGYSGESPASFPVVTEPAGLAVDVDNRRLYWTDAVDGSVHSSTLTGKGVTAVAQGGKARPMGIAVVREKDILGGD